MGAYDFSCGNCGKAGAGTPTGGSTLAPNGWVWNKSFGLGRKAFCSNKCLDEFKSRKSDNTNNSDSGNSQTNSGPGFMERMASADIKQAEADGIREEQEFRMKERQDSKINDIATIQFGSTKEEVTNIIEQLIVQGSNISVPKERKAISDKLELGINKLKQLGVDCSYYEEKSKKIKPTIWQKIGYYFANN
jgi:hypothetical protein